jgi:hypothetical protein
MHLRGTTEKTLRSPNGDRRARGYGKPRLAPRARRRNLAWLLLGILLVAGFALAFAMTSLRVSARQPALALARDVPAGHVLQSGDLTVVNVAADASLALIPSSSESTVLGRPVAVPLAGGSLLTGAELGADVMPPSGSAVVGVALKAGQYPPELQPGDHVLIVTAGGAASAGGIRGSEAAALAQPISAVVVGVQLAPVDGSAAAVVSLQVPEAPAASLAVASSNGAISLVLVSAQGGGS